MLEELPSALDSDSSGEESAGEGEKKEVDVDDQAERAELPHYVSRFKVRICSDQVGKVELWVTDAAVKYRTSPLLVQV